MDFSTSYKLSQVARGAGDIILKSKRDMQVTEKEGHGNFVTEYDLKVQDYIKRKLADQFPDAVFIGEEDDGASALPDGECFIIDPIDGTCNFMYDYKMSSVSIAYLRNRRVVAGVISQPYLNEYFTAELGKGARLNGVPIYASSRSLDNALILFGTCPYYPELWDKTFSIASECLKIGRDIRRSGSSAADMAWISAGRADLFYELRLSPWDFAAGSLICSEAGAKVVQPDGSPLDFSKKCGVVAGSPDAVDRFVSQFG